MFLEKGRRFRAFPLRTCLLLLAAFTVRAWAQPEPKKVDKPCKDGVLHSGHAYSKCIDGFWNVVSDDVYVCPDGSREMVTTTQKTSQKCEAGKPFDLVGHLRGNGPCQSPEPAGEVVVRKCVQGFWEEETYSRYKCFQDGFVIIGGPIRSERTTRPCEEEGKTVTTTPSEKKDRSNPEKSTDRKPSRPSDSAPPAPQKTPKTSPPPPPANTSTYICGKAVCDCMKQSPPKMCKAGSGCACAKG